jgi:hypothetical protein
LFYGEDQIGFQCFANYVPWVNKKAKRIYHSNRTVIHPDYAGLGMGVRLATITAQYMIEKYPYKIMGKFSSVPIFKAVRKDPAWKFLGETRTMGILQKGGTMERQGGFREGGIKTYQFEYIGCKK